MAVDDSDYFLNEIIYQMPTAVPIPTYYVFYLCTCYHNKGYANIYRSICLCAGRELNIGGPYQCAEQTVDDSQMLLRT